MNTSESITIERKKRATLVSVIHGWYELLSVPAMALLQIILFGYIYATYSSTTVVIFSILYIWALIFDVLVFRKLKYSFFRPHMFSFQEDIFEVLDSSIIKGKHVLHYSDIKVDPGNLHLKNWEFDICKRNRYSIPIYCTMSSKMNWDRVDAYRLLEILSEHNVENAAESLRLMHYYEDNPHVF